MRLRASRRHSDERIKNRVKKYLNCSNGDDPRIVGKMARTRAKCSCWMCGNPRRHFNELTIRERRFREAVRNPDVTKI